LTFILSYQALLTTPIRIVRHSAAMGTLNGASLHRSGFAGTVPLAQHLQISLSGKYRPNILIIANSSRPAPSISRARLSSALISGVKSFRPLIWNLH